jgi:hypothetical protein
MQVVKLPYPCMFIYNIYSDRNLLCLNYIHILYEKLYFQIAAACWAESL